MAVGLWAPSAQQPDPGVEWPELRELITQRIPERVLRRLAYVPAAELAALRPELKALRSRLRADLKAPELAVREAAYGQLAPLYLAGVLCSGSPAEALDWLTSPALRDASWQRADGSSREPDTRRVLLALLLDHRDGAWQRDLAGRLAQWLPASGDPRRWELVDGLDAWAAANPPASDGYVVGWVLRGSAIGRDHAAGRRDVREWFAERGWRPPVRHHATLLDWLRAQPRLAELVPRLFEVADVGGEFDDEDAARYGPQNEWPGALAALAAEGSLDRGALLDLCLGKLLRGDRPGNLRGFALLAERLIPSPDEAAARAETYVALAGRGAATAAKLAQSTLKELDAAGRLSTDTLAQLSSAVLARPEKNLAAAQLSWLDAAVRRDQRSAPRLLRAAAAAFAHPAVTVQERALRLIVRHLKHLAAEDRAALSEAAGGLDAVLRDEAVRLLGGGAVAASPDRTPAPLLPVYQPPAPPRPLGSVWELVELWGAVLADGAADATQVERVLDGLVAEHDRDPQILVEALGPLAERFPAESVEAWDQREIGGALRCLLHALLGRDRRAVVVMDELYGARAQSAAAPHWATLYRIYELVEHLGRDRVPCLLATPTDASGAVDAEVLRFRLERYERAVAEPLPCDLEQALLRVPVEDAQEVLAGSELLATTAGKELAVLFAGADGALPVFERFVIRRTDSIPRSGAGVGADTGAGWDSIDAASAASAASAVDEASAHGTVNVPRIAPRFSRAHESLGAADRTPSPISVLTALPDPDDARLFAWQGPGPGAAGTNAASWPSLLPFQPEVVAAHAIPALYQQANDTSRDRNGLLPALAATTGWPGPVTHLALAYGLAAGRPENRAAAVDALVTLASRRLLDARALGALCGELWADRMVKPNRLLLSLEAAAQAGARQEVFAAIAAALPALVPQPSVRGLADLLVLAAECARVADLREDLLELDELVALGRPERVAAEARRLRRILTPET